MKVKFVVLHESEKIVKILGMKKQMGVLVILSLFFLSPIPGFSLDLTKSFSFYHHNRWTVEEGLPVNTILSISQTSDGYIWLGTEGGLVRFDGIKFEVFDNENTPTFPNSIILDLLADSKGALWIGMRGGGLVRYFQGTFKVFKIEDGLLSNEVWALFESKSGSIWVGTRNGLNYLQDGKLYTIPLPKSVSSHFVRALLEDKNSRIWVGTWGGGLLLVDKRGNRYESEYKYLANQRINVLLEDHKGDIWVGTKEAGLVRIQGNNHFIFNSKNGLPHNYVGCLYEDQTKNLWIGTKGGGISYYQREKNHISVFDSQGNLGTKRIHDIYEDREKTLWIATQSMGLNSLRDNDITTYTTKRGLSHHSLYGVFQDSRGNIWTGTKGYGVNLLNLKTGQIKTFTTQDGLSSNSVISIVEHPLGSIWFGTLGGGINRLTLTDVINGEIEVFTVKNGLNDNFVRALYVDSVGNLWAGTESGGIHLFSQGRFIVVGNTKFRINAFLEDRKGNLWVATFGNGLNRLKNGNVEIIDEKKRLYGKYVYCMYEDGEGALWIGTSHGLNYFKDGIFKKISKKNGLPNNNVFCVLEDRKNHLWISSNLGIFWLNRRDINEFIAGKINYITPFVFGVEDGMKSIECNGGSQPSGWKSQDGRLWFPTADGLSVVDPENISINTLPPPLTIEKVIINGNGYVVGRNQTITVPPGKHHLQIQYTALSFVGPKRISFKYKLQGWDENWVDAGTRRFAIYTNIPPGSYSFRVIACNSDGIWNNNGASLTVLFKAKYYQTLMFKILFPIAVTFFIFFAYFTIKKYLAYRKFRKRYRGTHLTPEKSTDYLRKILHLIESEKLYRNPNITLKSLSEKMLINSRLISQVINEKMNKNFHQVINHYRIEEAKILLLNSEKDQRSILDISFEVGFNSKSSFNRVFKKFTTMTPSQFRKQKRA